MFNVKRRDNPSTDRYMDPKAKPFGGPSEKVDFDKSKRTTLKEYQRVVTRNSDFEGGAFNHNYDPTWKAITRDLIHRQANKKEFNPMYAKPTMATVPAVEEARIARFEEYVNENMEGTGFNMFAEAEEDSDMDHEEMEHEMEPEVDEEKLEMMLEEYTDHLNEMLEEISEKMEVERGEAVDLLCAALKKIKEEPAEEEGEEAEEEMPGAMDEEE